MSYRSGLRCCNDHMFVCPRELCSPYASLLDNFRDARCRAPPGYSSGGDGVKLDGTLREAPDLTWTSWYLSRAYNASGWAQCGRMRELGLLYSIARGSSSLGYLICQYTLSHGWNPGALVQFGLVNASERACALERCAELSDRLSGGSGGAANRTEQRRREMALRSQFSARWQP
mmetsp:Transcript_42986/g.140091  ORF Transcript_42986/g.140091 Transcript_42986/m.140091 type:complete len:174 (+) Transcript_42986:499-1020(+)